MRALVILNLPRLPRDLEDTRFDAILSFASLAPADVQDGDEEGEGDDGEDDADGDAYFGADGEAVRFR
jgi:hypothetical protein